MTIALPALDAAISAIGESLQRHEWATVAILDAILQDARMGNPIPIMRDVTEDAAWWAGNCSPIELEGYLVAIMQQLAETPLHARSRKRLIAALWKKMGAEDQASFIEWTKTNAVE